MLVGQAKAVRLGTDCGVRQRRHASHLLILQRHSSPQEIICSRIHVEPSIILSFLLMLVPESCLNKARYGPTTRLCKKSTKLSKVNGLNVEFSHLISDRACRGMNIDGLLLAGCPKRWFIEKFLLPAPAVY